MRQTNNLALSRLIGLPLCAIGRACDLPWLHFGELKEITIRPGDNRTVGEWALHIQDRWDISKSGSAVVSNADYYVDSRGQDLGADWDIVGANRFDTVARDLRAAFESAPRRVKSVACGDAEAFSLTFDDGSELRVLPAEGQGREAWRLFQPGNLETHFVAPE
jgi:hypothetical protein